MKHRFIVEIDVPDDASFEWKKDPRIAFTNTISKAMKFGMLHLLKSAVTNASMKPSVDMIEKVVNSFQIVRTDEFYDTEISDRY